MKKYLYSLIIFTLVFSTFSVLNSTAQVVLNSPNGGEIWVTNTVEEVSFNNLGLDNYFEIQISLDNGLTYYSVDFIYAFSGLNIYQMNVYYPATTEAKIKVVNYSFNTFFDESNEPFSIVYPSLLILQPQYLEYHYQNQPIDVEWLRSDPSTVVDVELSLDNGQTWTLVGDDIDTTFYTFIAPPQSTSSARVKITNIADPSDFAMSEPFYIFPEPEITLVTPNGGEVWNYWENYAIIQWTGQNLSNFVDFYISTDGGLNWIFAGSGYSNPGSGSAQIDIPYVSSDNVLLKVVDASGISDVSDAPFSIYIAPLNLVYPNSYYTYFAGGNMNIVWYAFETETVKIELSTDNGQSYFTIAENLNASQASYYYQIPQTIYADQCIVRISDQNDPQIFDSSEVFEILPPPTITIISPNGGEFLNTGTEYQISWNYDNMVYDYTNLFVEFSPNNGLSWQYLGSIYQYGQSTTFSWVTPASESDNCLIRITDAYYYNIVDVSDAVFSIRDIPETPICMVSVDMGTGKNVIIWEPVESDLIAEYVVFKETNQFNVYEEIGSLAQGASTTFIDFNSNPMVQASRYKLSFRDAEGNEFPKSDFHQTIHLTIGPGVGNAWNLNWSPYQGFEVTSYNIYRSYNGTDMELIATISGSFTSYTDFGATSPNVYYMVEVVSPEPCFPSNPQNSVFNYASSTSNIAASVVTSIENPNSGKYHIYPNPAGQSVRLSLPVKSEGSVKIDFLQATGQIVKSYDVSVAPGDGGIEMDLSELSNGMYIVRISDTRDVYSLRLIIRK